MQNARMNDSPILITGVYRSGTTLLSNMLGAHPKINFTYGTVNYLRWVTKPYLKPVTYKDIVSDCASLVGQRFNKKLRIENILSKIESTGSEPTHDLIYNAIMHEYFNDEGRWGEKILMEWRNIPLFLTWFPNGKVIHIIRDPRDVTASFKNMTFEKGDRYLDAVFACIDSMDAALEYENTISRNNYLSIKYEDLILDSGSSLTTICEFLGEEFSHTMLDESAYVDQMGNKFDAAAHSSFGERGGGVMSGASRSLDLKALALINWAAKDRMTLFDYECEEPKASFNEVMDMIKGEGLIKERFVRLILENTGVDVFPSDPKDKKNWTVVNKQGKDAKSKYLRA